MQWPRLELLEAGHSSALLAFETENRRYFAASIGDRGDEFFAHFDDMLASRLAYQAAGTDAYYLLVAEDGAILGRFNIVAIQDGAAELGYRIAERAAGRGLATAAVGDICDLAASRHALTVLRAATSDGNLASQRVLVKNGFVKLGPAAPAEIGGQTGSWYQRDLTPSAH